MKTLTIGLQMIVFLLVMAEAGCEQAQLVSESPPKADNDFDFSTYTSYDPVKVDIMPLTEFVSPGDAEGTPKINVYVSLLDSFGSQKKSPGIFRFEMYEHVQRSAEPKGGRSAIWPDVDLTNAAENNKYWRDFLRAYQFNLPFEPSGNQTYILQVTFLCPTGKRLSDEFTLKHTR